MRVPLADQSGQLVSFTRNVRIGRFSGDIRLGPALARGGWCFSSLPVPLALFVGDQVRAHRPRPVFVHTPTGLGQLGRGI